MCGIIGCVGTGNETLDVLMNGLSNLEYRGYDSAGIALANHELTVIKKSGDLAELRAQVSQRDGALNGEVGIGHTRWSTHGPPTDSNAHPHSDCTGRISVVHNGIIENYQSLRDELEDAGHTFVSETDTEVIPHLIETELPDVGFPTAFRRAIERIEGSFAVAAISAGNRVIMGARHRSPLVVGIDDDAFFLGSDVPAFLQHTDRVVYLEDGHVAQLSPDGVTVTDLAGEPITVDSTVVDWDPEETGKGGYQHYMLKEIHEQPEALRQCLQGRVDELMGRVTLTELDDIDTGNPVHFVACGTSYHAAAYAALLLQDAGIPATAFLASEYAIAPPPLSAETLVVGVTQSGETADTLRALEEARHRSARTLAITNVVGSTAERECDHVVHIRAGPEIGVAATKTFSSQVVTANILATVIRDREGEGFPRKNRSREIIAALRDLPRAVQSVLDESRAAEIADQFIDADAYFFIGRHFQYPVALEGALKMKEITYRHAEGFAAGELKHGPLALVTESTPVFAGVIGADDAAQKTIGNIKEVETRGAPVIAVTDGATEVGRYTDETLQVPQTHPFLAPILVNVQFQLVAYHTARLLGRSIDKPRNLAKSVTVE